VRMELQSTSSGEYGSSRLSRRSTWTQEVRCTGRGTTTCSSPFVRRSRGTSQIQIGSDNALRCVCKKQEDDKLRMLVSTHGPGSWSTIAQVGMVVTSNGAYDICSALLDQATIISYVQGVRDVQGARHQHKRMLK
jgi:hypothetical protein